MFKTVDKILRLTLLLALAFSSSGIMAQQRSLEIIGTAEHDMNPIPGATVILYKDGAEDQKVNTGSNGEFRFKLDMNHEYLVEIRKNGLLSKRIAFNTEIPDDFVGQYTMEFAMSLIKGCEGVNTSALNDPVDRIKFSSNKSEFISDEVYVDRMRSRLGRMMMEIDQCQADKYQQAVNDAERLAKSGDLAEAKKKYEEALEVYPDDRSVQKKLDNLQEKLEESNENLALYEDAIEKADKYYNEQSYEQAREYYRQAAAYQPGNSYAAGRVAEIDKTLTERTQAQQAAQAKEQQYTSLVSKANVAFNAKNYVQARELYKQALLVKPEADFARQKVAELEPLIAQQQSEQAANAANEQAYSEAMAMGQLALDRGEYEAAKQHFNRALALKPNQSLPMQKVRETEEAIEAAYLANIKAEKAEAQSRIEQLLDQGDTYFDQENYAEAEKAYSAVLDIDPNDRYAAQRLNRTRSLIASAQAEKQQQLENSFRDAVSKGDVLMTAGSFEQAIAAYKQALVLKPQDPGAQSKLAAAEQKQIQQRQQLAQEEARKAEYEKLMAEGNNQLASRNYDAARSAFQRALSMFPNQEAPKSRLQEIDRLVAQQVQTEKYQSLITTGDNMLSAGNLSQAKISYQQALALRSNDSYATGKIAEIDARLARQQQEAAQQAAREQKYNALIAEGDRLFGTGQYPEAKAQYQQAAELQPQQNYPGEQIARIDNLLAEQQKAASEKQAREEQFRSLVARADALYAAQDYTGAKLIYQQAKALKADEPYPTSKISEIDAILAQQARQEAEQQARKQQYESLIAEADGFLSSGNLDALRSKYQQAMAIMTDQPYPAAQIRKIDDMITEQARLEEEKRAQTAKYQGFITRGDALLAQQQYDEARRSYQSALGIKPGESYPQAQIAKIDTELAARRKKEEEQRAFEQRYASLISSADASFNNRKYDEAREGYREALVMKPSESYPQQQLNKIAELERILAKQQADREAAIAAAATTTAAASGAATAAKAAPLAALDFKNDSERDAYLSGLGKEYPVGVTKEVHSERNSTTERYVVIRDNEVREFRKVRFSWGGVEYSLNGKPITSQYFDSQVKPRDGEFFQEIKK